MDGELPRCIAKSGTNIVQIININSPSCKLLRNDSEPESKILSKSVGKESKRHAKAETSSAPVAGRWSEEEQLLFVEGTSLVPSPS